MEASLNVNTAGARPAPADPARSKLFDREVARLEGAEESNRTRLVLPLPRALMKLMLSVVRMVELPPPPMPPAG